MGKKNYITEITDTFGSEMNPKEALKLAKKMKSAQNLAYPSSEYKMKLKDRLHNIYLIDQGTEFSPRFSIFQIFGILASFTFIAGATFMVFDVRQDSGQSVYQNIISEENIDIKKTRNKPEVDLIQEDNTEIIMPQNTQAEPLSTGRNMEKSVSPAGDANMYSEDMPFGSMMMDMGVGETQEMSFTDVCSEYSGILSDDEIYCILPEGVLCEEYNIYECALGEMNTQKDSTIEIDLEELIEMYGQ